VRDEPVAFGNGGIPILADSVGLYAWDMVANKFCGDAEMAYLFALDPAELAAGVTIEQFIGCLHTADRERVAKALHTAIVMGTLCREVYRVHIGKGRYRNVLGVLRCFGYSDGLPTTCSGFVCETRSPALKPAPLREAPSNVVQLRTTR